MSEIPLPIQTETATPAYECMRGVLGDEGMRLLDAQLNIWHGLNEEPVLDSPLRESLSGGNTLLPQGTLMHGVRFDIDTLRGISELGVVSGELLGVFEDAETHGCADFFKVPAGMSISDYYQWAREPVQVGAVRTSKGERNYLVGGVAVIMDPGAQGVALLLEKDAYQDRTMDFTRLPYGRDSKTTAAILGGMPKGAIAGLVFPDRIANDEVNMAEVRALFPETPLLTQSGALVASAVAA